MPVLLLKLLLTPLLVSAASLGGRRWGPAVGGWLVGLPLTSAPVAVILTAEHGADFAATAALGILGGVASQAVFAVAYARGARRGGPGPALLAATAGFAASTTLLSHAPLPLAGMVALAAAALVASLPFLGAGSSQREPRAAVPLPAWDLPARAVVATGFVALVTGIAGAAGPRLAGLITPFPIYALVLTAFAHRALGAPAAVATLRGLVVGLFAFLAFFTVLAAALPHIGWAAFAGATAASGAVQVASLGAVSGTVSSRP